MNWYLTVLKKYTDFSGRARRAEYWYFTLFNMLIIIGLALIDATIGTFDEQSGFGLLGGLYMLAVLVPSIAVLVRRVHDIGRSGWWCFLLLIPIIGPLAILVMTVLPSADGTNDYGDNPIEAAATS